MAKNEEKKIIVDEFAELRLKRKEAAEALLAEKEAEINQREEFRKFFIKLNSQLKLNRDMENVLWLHLKASGFDKKDKFVEGIQHFGYKL